jgi:hypothetical protein
VKVRDRLIEALRLYFILVTFITILLLIVGQAFDGDRTFGYEAFLSPLVYAAIGVLPTLFLYSDKELSMTGLIIKNILQLLIIEAIVMILVFTKDTIPSEKKSVVVSIAVGIALIYVLTMVVEYIFELSQSKAMNESLEKYQKQSDSAIM